MASETTVTNVTPKDLSVSGQSSVAHPARAAQAASLRPYSAPVLLEYGDVRDVTMGPTVGFGESGGGPQCALGVNCP